MRRIATQWMMIAAVLALIPTGSGSTRQAAGQPVPTRRDDAADEAFLAEKYAEAYTLYQQRALRNPNDLDAQDGVTACALKTGKVKEAAAWYQNMPSSVPAWCYGAARAVLADGDRKQASALLFRALDINKGLGRAYFLLGLLYSTQSVPDYPTAMNALTRATQLEPKYGPSYYQLARLEAGLRAKPAEAKALLTKALLYLTPVQKDVRVQAHVLFGGLLSGERDYAGALKQFEAVRALIGDAVYEQVNIGRVYELMGDPEGARREWTAVQKRFGLASPAGLQAFRSIRRVRSKASIDFSDFLPGAGPADYALLLTRLASPRPPQTVAIPANVARLLDALKVPVRLIETDLDGDGKVELVVVEAASVWDPDLKGYYAGKPVVHVFTPKGGAPGYCDSAFDHFWDVRVIDFNGDGRKEIVLAAFSTPNVLSLLVMTHQGRRILPTFAQTIPCVASPCGALIDDLDGDGKIEILTVEGGDLWVTVRRWNDAGTFADASADFPEFYEDYVRKYERLKPAELEPYPIVRRHLSEAHTILLTAANRKARAAEGGP